MFHASDRLERSALPSGLNWSRHWTSEACSRPRASRLGDPKRIIIRRAETPKDRLGVGAISHVGSEGPGVGGSTTTTPAVCTGPKIEIAGDTLSRAQLLREGRGSFCAAGNSRGQIEAGLARGLLWPGAALEQWSNICCNEDSTLQGYMALGRSEKSERPSFSAMLESSA